MLKKIARWCHLFPFSEHPRHPPGGYDSGVKYILARNPTVPRQKMLHEIGLDFYAIQAARTKRLHWRGVTDI